MFPSKYVSVPKKNLILIRKEKDIDFSNLFQPDLPQFIQTMM